MVADRFDNSIPILIDRVGVPSAQNRAGNGRDGITVSPTFAATRIANSADSMRVASASASGTIVKGWVGAYRCATSSALISGNRLKSSCTEPLALAKMVSRDPERFCSALSPAIWQPSRSHRGPRHRLRQIPPLRWPQPPRAPMGLHGLRSMLDALLQRCHRGGLTCEQLTADADVSDFAVAQDRPGYRYRSLRVVGGFAEQPLVFSVGRVPRNDRPRTTFESVDSARVPVGNAVPRQVLCLLANGVPVASPLSDARTRLFSVR